MRVLFVCSGNVCRSPLAEGVMRQLATSQNLHIQADSAGLQDEFIGEAPHVLSVETAASRGIDITGHRVRKVSPEDFENNDLIVALDRSDLRILTMIRPRRAPSELRLFSGYSGDDMPTDIPDPYHGDAAKFETVFELIEQGTRNLLANMREQIASAEVKV